MENQPWDKAKLEEWKKFWESEMGQEALAKMKSLKMRCLDFAVQAKTDEVTFYVGRAAGIDLILQDIEAGIRAANEAKKKEAEPEKAK